MKILILIHFLKSNLLYYIPLKMVNRSFKVTNTQLQKTASKGLLFSH